MTDSELLDLIYDNDLEGMSSLIDRYAVAVYKTVADVLSGVGTQEDIEDCVADAFVAFYNNIDDVDLSRAGVKAYLCVIAFRRAVNLYFTISPDSDKVFSEYTVEEMSEAMTDEPEDEMPVLSEVIKTLCFKELDFEYASEETSDDITEDYDEEASEEYFEEDEEEPQRDIPEKNHSVVGSVLKRLLLVVTFVVIVLGGVAAYNEFYLPETTTTTTTTQPTTEAQPYNPLLSAIIAGNEKLITDLISNSLLLTQDILTFAIESADKISYDSIRKIAEEVKKKYGETGLEPILEDAILGDIQSVLDRLRNKSESEMTPAEKLAYFFAQAIEGGKTE